MNFTAETHELVTLTEDRFVYATEKECYKISKLAKKIGRYKTGVLLQNWAGNRDETFIAAADVIGTLSSFAKLPKKTQREVLHLYTLSDVPA